MQRTKNECRDDEKNDEPDKSPRAAVREWRVILIIGLGFVHADIGNKRFFGLGRTGKPARNHKKVRCAARASTMFGGAMRPGNEICGGELVGR